jgi:hypothetical protein
MSSEYRNPHIENFCRVLIEKHETQLSTEAKDKLTEDLYKLFENMLGRKMVDALPEETKKEFIARYDKGTQHIDYEHMGEVFDRSQINAEEIIKETMKEFTALYFKNR